MALFAFSGRPTLAAALGAFFNLLQQGLFGSSARLSLLCSCAFSNSRGGLLRRCSSLSAIMSSRGAIGRLA
jgi:hypothetical protein